MNQLIAGNQISLLRNGAAYFPALEAAIDSAQYEIYLQTYIFELDETGLCIGEALKRAATRGVMVCVLLDGFGCKDLPSTFAKEMEITGVELLIYRPKISPWTLKRSRLRRMHRKIAVIDGRIGFVGGINIIDDSNTPSQLSPRLDYAVKVEGPLLPAMRASTMVLWRKLCKVNSRPVRESVLKYNAAQLPAGAMQATFLLRDNLWHRNEIEDAYLTMIKSAKSEILIANAYFLPGLRFRHALRDAAGRGIHVTLLLQRRVEYMLLDYASHALYSSLLSQGIVIYEYHKSFMHSKVAVVDGRWAMVGSSNIDPFSLMMSREANVLIKDIDFAKELKLDIEASINTGANLMTIDEWEKQHYLKRFFSWVIYGAFRLLLGVVGYSDKY